MKRLIQQYKRRFELLFLFLFFLVIISVPPQVFFSQKFVFYSFKNKQIAKTTIKKPIPTHTPKNVEVIPKANAETLEDYCVNVPVLLYHHIQPHDIAVTKGQTALNVDVSWFDTHMEYIKRNGYTVISSEKLIDVLLNRSPLPEKPIVITLDDAYKDAFEYAYPILKKYNIYADIMVPTGLVGLNDYVTWSDLAEMKASGLVGITNHTVSHFPVGYGEYDKVIYELQESTRNFKDNLKLDVAVFTYPYGSFNDLSISLLQQEGFKGAYSTIEGTMQCRSYIYTLHRSHIGNAPLSAYGL